MSKPVAPHVSRVRKSQELTAATAAAAAAEIDWVLVEDELRRAGADLNSPNFNALKHVVREVFSARDPQGRADDLRDLDESLSFLVDQVVDGYHVGFAKSIQMYSQVLHLFQESHEQVDFLRRALANSSRQLSAQSSTLNQQWRRSVSLEASLKMLADVQAVVDIPAKLQAASATKDWPAAVGHLLDGCNKLSREDLAQVGALSELKSDMHGLHMTLQDQMCEDLQSRVYSAATAPLTNYDSATLPDVLSPSEPSFARRPTTMTPGAAPSTSRFNHSNSLQMSEEFGEGPASGGRRDRSVAGRRRGSTMSRAALAGRSEISLRSGFLNSSLQQQSSLSDSGQEDGRAGQIGTRELVACLAQVEGVDKAKTFLNQHARTEVRKFLLAAVEEFAEDVAQTKASQPPAASPATATAAPLSQAQVQLPQLGPHSAAGLQSGGAGGGGVAGGVGGGGGGGGEAAPGAYVSAAAYVSSRQLLLHVCDACLQVLDNLGDVLSEVADAPWSASSTSAALTLLRSLQEGQHGSAPATPSLDAAKGASARRGRGAGGAAAGLVEERRAYISGEFQYTWQLMQEELMLLLAELLVAPLRGFGIRAWQKQQRQAIDAGNAAAAGPGGFVGAAGAAVETAIAAATFLSNPLHIWLQNTADLAEAALGGELAVRPAAVEAAPVAAAPPPPPSVIELPEPSHQLTFAFDVTVPGLMEAAAQVWDMPGQDSGQDGESTSYSKLVHKALEERPGSPYLMPAVYSLLVDFSAEADEVIREEAERRGGGRERGRRAVPWLQQVLDDFTTESFLPQLWIDLRGRCTAALEEPGAFRPQPIFTAGAIRPSGDGTAGRSYPKNTSANGGVGAGGTDAGRTRAAVLPAAAFTMGVLQEVVQWLEEMPTFEVSLTGVIENLLTVVLEAFANAHHTVSGESRSTRLAASAELCHVMASERDALLLLEPHAFYVPPPRGPEGGGGTWDATPFLLTLRLQERPTLVPQIGRPPAGPRGFAVGGVSAELDVQHYTYRERPAKPDELLSGGAGSSPRIVQLAALSESLGVIVETLLSTAGKRSSSQSGADPAVAGPPGLRGKDGGRQPVAVQHGDVELPDTLWTLVHRYRSLAGRCMRMLRLEALLLVAGHLHQLALAQHVLEDDGLREVHPSVGALLRSVTRLSEEVLPYLSPLKAAYMLGLVASATANMLLWLLTDIREINHVGIDRMVRTLDLLQPVLVNLVPPATKAAAAAVLAAAPTATAGAPTDNPAEDEESEAIPPGASSLDAREQLAFERARGYYALLTVPAEEVVRAAGERPMLYSYNEWVALLQVRVVGRAVSDHQLQALRGTLDRAHGISAGQKVAEVMGNVVSTIQAPVMLITDTMLAGAEGLRTGVQMTAKQTTRALRMFAEVTHVDKVVKSVGRLPGALFSLPDRHGGS